MGLSELEIVMDVAPLPVLASNDAGYYVYENEAAQRFLGYGRAGIIGKQLTDLIAYDPRLVMGTFERLKRQGYLSGRARYRHADGNLREANVNIFRQSVADETQVFVSLIHPLPGVGELLEPERIFDLGLTDTQMRLLQLMADGFSDEQVARLLGETEDAIDQQMQELLQRMNASSRTEAAVLAIKKRAVL